MQPLQEQVVLANQSMDKDLLAFYDKGLGDMHSYNAQKIFPELHDVSLKDIKKFHKALKAGISFAGNGFLITFGIVPTAPETGYGYIRKGKVLERPDGAQVPDGITGYEIDRFVEKPDRETAETYIASGNFCWNSGMFMFKASVVLEELKKRYDGEFYITPAVKKELIDRPLKGKLFKLEALQLMSFISKGIIPEAN